MKSKYFQKTYEFKCPECGTIQYAKPSMAMHSGLNTGRGKCIKCNIFLHLEITPDIYGKKMIAKTWYDYLVNIQKKQSEAKQ